MESKINKYIYVFITAAVICSGANVVFCSEAVLPISLSSGPVISSAPAVLQGPQITFAETLHNFGKAKEGDKVVFKFEFTNTGAKDLVIDKIRPTCGCTAAVVSTGPYHPGDKGIVDVSFNSYGRAGPTHKEIAVFSNAPGSPCMISFEGLILDKNDASFSASTATLKSPQTSKEAAPSAP